MNAFKLIIPQYFFASLAIGIALSLWWKPEVTYIKKTPTPYNTDSVTYKDPQNTCYKYSAQQVTCPSDGVGVQHYNFQ